MSLAWQYLFVCLPKVGVTDGALAVNRWQGLPQLLCRLPSAIANKHPYYLTRICINGQPNPLFVLLRAYKRPHISHVDCQGDLLQSTQSLLLIPHPALSRYNSIQESPRQSVIRSHCHNSATLSSFVVKGAAPQTSKRGRKALTEMWTGSQPKNLSMHA